MHRLASGHLFLSMLFSLLSIPATLPSLRTLEHLEQIHVLGLQTWCSLCLEFSFPNVHTVCSLTSIRSIFEYRLLGEVLLINLSKIPYPHPLLHFFIFLLGAFPIHICFTYLSYFWSSSPLSECKFHEGGNFAWFC